VSDARRRPALPEDGRQDAENLGGRPADPLWQSQRVSLPVLTGARMLAAGGRHAAAPGQHAEPPQWRPLVAVLARACQRNGG